jgi:hypothetical protein
MNERRRAVGSDRARAVEFRRCAARDAVASWWKRIVARFNTFARMHVGQLVRASHHVEHAIRGTRASVRRFALRVGSNARCAGTDDSRRRALAGIEPARDIEVRMMSKVNTTRASMAPAPGTQSWRNAGKPAAARIRLVPRPAPCARYASGDRVILWTSAGAVIRRSCIGHAWRRA